MHAFIVTELEAQLVKAKEDGQQLKAAAEVAARDQVVSLFHV